MLYMPQIAFIMKRVGKYTIKITSKMHEICLVELQHLRNFYTFVRIVKQNGI